MPFCTQCGHSNTDDARFCSNCGAALKPAARRRRRPGETSTITIGGGLRARASRRDKSEGAVHRRPGRPSTRCRRARRCSSSGVGPTRGSRFLLDSDTTTAGRHPSSDIFLDDVTVSRRHAEFVRVADGFSVRDVGSLNGTYVNRERIDEATLAGGDEVQVGKYRLVFYPSQHGPMSRAA